MMASRSNFHRQASLYREAGMYLQANEFLKQLKEHADVLTAEQWMGLRIQALDGDISGAHSNLRKILHKKA